MIQNYLNCLTKFNSSDCYFTIGIYFKCVEFFIRASHYSGAFISFPDSILTGYPYFTDTNLDEIAELLNALGTGISELKIVEVPVEVIKSKIPDELYNRIVCKPFKNISQNL